ncbi:MAG: TIGR03619 family F420-dependent LLM class oxidoreductase [Gaiellales bacterium]
MPGPRLIVVLSEMWTMTSPRDLRALVRMAAEAEDAGADAVMLSEHLVLGPQAAANGLMPNPREYALPGNQDPAMPWPSSIVLLAAMAQATSGIRLAASAIIAPLRHPLVLAKELATLDLLSEGRLVVQPTVSWHRDEYAALGVPFGARGALLDEHLGAWRELWGRSPASWHGVHYRFDDVYLEPKPHRAEGPRLWFGGESLHPRLLARLVEYGHGFNPLGRPSDEDLARLAGAMAARGRSMADLEMVGGTRGTFAGPGSVADLDQALDSVGEQVERGFTSICMKPSQFSDDPRMVGPLCRRAVERLAAFSS